MIVTVGQTICYCRVLVIVVTVGQTICYCRVLVMIVTVGQTIHMLLQGSCHDCDSLAPQCIHLHPSPPGLETRKGDNIVTIFRAGNSLI